MFAEHFFGNSLKGDNQGFCILQEGPKATGTIKCDIVGREVININLGKTTKLINVHISWLAGSMLQLDGLKA